MKDNLVFLVILNICISLYLLLTNSSHRFFKYRFMAKKPIKISSYGFISALAAVLSLCVLFKGHIAIIKLLYVIIIYGVFLYLVCEKCRNHYFMIATYYTLIPVAGLLFNCTELSIFLLAFSLFTALSRFACLSAGCCNGKILDDNHKENFYIEYKDSEQRVNIKRNTTHTKTFPITLYEIIIQHVLVLLLLLYPKYSTQIFSVMSIILIIFSATYRENRERLHSDKSIFALALFSVICYSKGIKDWKILSTNKLSTRHIFMIVIIPIILLLFTSNNIDLSKAKNYILPEEESSAKIIEADS